MFSLILYSLSFSPIFPLRLSFSSFIPSSSSTYNHHVFSNSPSSSPLPPIPPFIPPSLSPILHLECLPHLILRIFPINIQS